MTWVDDGVLSTVVPRGTAPPPAARSLDSTQPIETNEAFALDAASVGGGYVVVWLTPDSSTAPPGANYHVASLVLGPDGAPSGPDAIFDPALSLTTGAPTSHVHYAATWLGSVWATDVEWNGIDSFLIAILYADDGPSHPQVWTVTAEPDGTMYSPCGLVCVPYYGELHEGFDGIDLVR